MQKRLGLSDKITKYLIATLLIVIPVYPKFPFIDIPNTHVFVRLEDVIMLFAGLFLAYFVLKDLKGFFKDRVNKSAILFLLIGLLSLISALFVTKTVTPSLGALHWLRRVEYLIPLFLGIVVLKRPKEEMSFYIKAIILAIFIVFIYGIGQKHLGWPVIATQNEEVAKGIAQRFNPGSHLYSTFAGHYDLAAYLVLMMPILVSLFYTLKGLKTRIILAVISLAGLWLMANSLSRISVFSYMGAVTISLFLLRKYKAIFVVLGISVLMFGLTSHLLDRYSSVFRVVREKTKLQSMVVAPAFAQEEGERDIFERRERGTPEPTPAPVIEDRSLSIRLNVEWPRAIRAFKKNPLLGTGYSSLTLATDNDYLRALGEVGLLGLFAFFAFFTRVVNEVLLAHSLRKKVKDKLSLGFLAGVFGAIPGVLLNAVFIDIFEASKFAITFWLIMGIAIALIRNEKFAKKS